MTRSEIDKRTAQERVLDFIAGKVPPARWSPTGKGKLQRADGLSVLYINLDSQPDRREHIEKELDALALPYRRVPAVKEPYGPLGCLKSHIKALRIARENATPWTIVFEDDFGFEVPLNDARARIRFVLENGSLAPVWLGDWFINGPEPSRHPAHPNVKMANGACNSSACYFVRHDYSDVLQATWEAALANLVTDLRQTIKDKRSNKAQEIAPLWWYATDAAWAPLQVRDHWLLFDPRLGTQQGTFSGNSIQSSIAEFKETGYFDVSPDAITTDIT